jgi:hypothetical protein
MGSCGVPDAVRMRVVAASTGDLAFPNPQERMPMQITLDADDLRPLIQQVVAETLRELDTLGTPHSERLAYTEPEAAALLGVGRHVLRDCRLRGEVAGSKCGKRVVYRRADLIGFLEENRR